MSKIISFLHTHKASLDVKVAALIENEEALLTTGLKESGLDSLDYLEMIMRIEDHFEISISEEAAAKASTFKDLDILIDKTMAECCIK